MAYDQREAGFPAGMLVVALPRRAGVYERQITAQRQASRRPGWRPGPCGTGSTRLGAAW
jgi:hypothetical protein